MTAVEVAIGPGPGPGQFAVEVLRSPAGEASEVVAFDPAGLLRRQPDLQRAVLASAVPTRRVFPDTEQPVLEVGRQLFAALLGSGDVMGRYRASAAMAAERGEVLRVVLRVGTAMLARLPWEAMYDDVAGSYVCRHEQLVRQIPVGSVPAPLPVGAPLRILGVVSAPRDLGALDADGERDLLTRALSRSVADGLVELTWAESATWDDLHDQLLAGHWHVLHFIGHGGFNSTRDEGVIALTMHDGRADMIEAQRFTDLLRQARPMPRLVVLNSCSSGAAGVADLFSGAAAALVRGGVSAVVAMQFEISDMAAAAFARGFYSAVAHGRAVDEAASAGRISIVGMSDRTLEWLTPVLYLRGRQSRLFDYSPHDPAPVRPDNGDPAVALPQDRAGAVGTDARTADQLREECRYSAAADAYRSLLSANPQDSYAQAGLAEALRGLGRYAEAETAAWQAIRLDPGYGWAHAVLGHTLIGTGRNDEALTALRE